MGSCVAEQKTLRHERQRKAKRRATPLCCSESKLSMPARRLEIVRSGSFKRPLVLAAYSEIENAVRCGACRVGACRDRTTRCHKPAFAWIERHLGSHLVDAGAELLA